MISLASHLANLDSNKAASEIDFVALSGQTWFCGGKTLGKIFDEDDIANMKIGPSLGVSDDRGCYDHWPVYLDGALIGHLLDDASGYAYYDLPASDDEAPAPTPVPCRDSFEGFGSFGNS